MRAYVIFDSRYGNTEKVARAIERGMRGNAVETSCSKVSDVSFDVLGQSDLLVIGGPTQYRTVSPSMSEFLENVKRLDLYGKYGFAFDTRVDSWWSGSAAAVIEKKLRQSGMEILTPHASAYVRQAGEGVGTNAPGRAGESKEERETRREREKEERRASVVLEEGAELSFEKIGADLANSLAAKTQPASALDPGAPA